ncbi:hypothetical protein [Crenothrix sp.]|uniref:hypothetical protein n=1 Tax=Crenothrix sp. TaxID=3100433 RepID=UPI00374CA7D3
MLLSKPPGLRPESIHVEVDADQIPRLHGLIEVLNLAAMKAAQVFPIADSSRLIEKHCGRARVNFPSIQYISFS